MTGAAPRRSTSRRGPMPERRRIPGVAVAVLARGRVSWARGYGFANLEQQIPMSPDTVLNTGSVTKTVTATPEPGPNQQTACPEIAPTTITPKKLTNMMIRFSAKGEVTRTLPPVPKSTLACAKAPPDISTKRKPSPKKTTK